MLQSIRDHTQGWIAGVIISILILSFALWGIHSYLASSGSSFVVAKVNGTEITKSQLAVAYERMRRQLQIQYSANYSLPTAAEANLKQQALQALINIQVLKQASLAQDYRVSSNQIDYYLESMPEFQVNGRFSLARFQQLLATTLYTANDFLGLINTNLLIEQPRLGQIFTSFSLPDEVAYAISLVNQERDIDYIEIPVTKRAVSISADNIKNYYLQHQNEFKTPEQASIEYIQFTLPELMKKIHFSDETLKNFYTENINTFTVPAQWKLETIYIPVREQATQQEVSDAITKSKQVMQQLQQGQITPHQLVSQNITQSIPSLQGWMALSQVPAELQKPLMSLTKAGMMTQPVKTQNGYVILIATDLKPATVQPLAEVKNKVKATLAHQQAEEKFAEMKEKLANLTYEHPESLSHAAKELALPIKTSDVFTKDKGADAISMHNKIREAAFSNEVLMQQNNSDVIQLTSDSALVLRIKSHAPATLLELKVVEQQVKDKLRAAQADAETLKIAESIKTALQQNQSITKLLAENHLTWKRVGYIGRQAKKISSAIQVAAFSMPRPTDAVKRTYTTVKIPGGSYAVVALNAVRNGQFSKNHTQQQNVFAEQIQNAQGLLEYELYKNSVVSKAKIVIENPDKQDV